MHTKTTERAKFEADYLGWIKARLARGGLPEHMVTLYTATVARLEAQGVRA